LRSPVREELLDSFKNKEGGFVLVNKYSFENMDIADAIILKPYVGGNNKIWEYLIDYNVLENYIINDLKTCFYFQVKYPSEYNIENLYKDYCRGDVGLVKNPRNIVDVAYLPGLDGKKIEVELIIV
jgi:hypothetical protein